MKTIEEAATNAYGIEVLSSGCNAGVTFGKEMFKHGVEFAQRWIPIEKELPEEGVPVIVMLGYKFVGTNIQATDICRLSENIWINCLRPHHSNGNITHWRPIELK